MNLPSPICLRASRCKGCGSLAFPARPQCDQCLSSDMADATIPGVGVLSSHTTIHTPPEGFEHLAPYTIGVVDLHPVGRVMGWLSPELDTGRIQVGMRVRLRWVDPEQGEGLVWIDRAE